MSGRVTTSRVRRSGAIAIAALLFAAVFVLRLVDEDPDEIITFLYALPITFVAVELGLAWGLSAAAFALGLFAVWDLGWNASEASPVNYLTRAAAFSVFGGATGALADRLRAVSADAARFWELSPDLLCTVGHDGHYRRLNPAWERMLGWTEDELRSVPLVEFIHPDDRERVVAELADLAKVGHETIGFECRHRCRDGSHREIVWGARSAAEVDLIYATGKDVSESKRAQQELRDSERFLASVFEHLPGMVFVKDAETLEFVRFNRAGEELLGLAREDLIGRTDHDRFPPEVADALVRKDREVLASDSVCEIVEELLDATGDGARILHTRKTAIRDERGEPRYLLGVSEDITVRKRAEQAAEAAQAEAARANEAKSEFLSRMSHELRTPLNAILGFGQLLELDDLEPQQRESVTQILGAGRHLLTLVNEVLDLARIEAGAMSLSVEPIRLDGVLAEARAMIRPLAEDDGVRLQPLPELADAHVLADRQRLKQVFINLFSNAVKYNRRDGEVAVRFEVLADGRSETAITDTGRGIAEHDLARLFAPFERLGEEGDGVEGTGLGLALCRGLVEAMGGEILVESQPRKGTTVRVLLRTSAAPEL